MKKIAISIIFSSLLATLSGSVFAQEVTKFPVKDSAITVVGDGNKAPLPDTGDTDGLAPGEFELPFRCNLDYWSLSYPGHSAYSVDINRGAGADDQGDPILASAEGVVYDIYSLKGQVTLRHEGDYYSSYTHMRNINISEGQRVKLGQKIGEIGDVGSSGAYHLHVNHSKNKPPHIESSRIQVCYKRYGCNPVSLATNDKYRYGTDYNRGCQ